MKDALLDRVCKDYLDTPIRVVSVWTSENKAGLVYEVNPKPTPHYLTPLRWYAVSIFRSPSESGRWGLGDCLFHRGSLHASEATKAMKRHGLAKVK
jgi:hypothetical protein